MAVRVHFTVFSWILENAGTFLIIDHKR